MGFSNNGIGAPGSVYIEANTPTFAFTGVHRRSISPVDVTPLYLNHAIRNGAIETSFWENHNVAVYKHSLYVQ